MKKHLLLKREGGFRGIHARLSTINSAARHTVALICKPILRHKLPPICKSLCNNPVTCPDEEALAAAAGGPSGVPFSQAAGPPPLLLARQAARGLQAPDSHQDRVHSGEHTSTSVGVFELIDKSVSHADIGRRHHNLYAKLHLPAVQFGAVPLLQADMCW